ncbi:MULTISPECIES: hypothetical protein [Paenibacillus]|uniref:hypothetical protein n=1 Tax=Paenibacillus TaxID=44249 RepID=UPI0009D6C342|nr:hypothetical protein [Paenibacillus odorifer]
MPFYPLRLVIFQYKKFVQTDIKLRHIWYKKAEQGGYTGRRATFGYKAKKRQKYIQVDERQALTVRRVF